MVDQKKKKKVFSLEWMRNRMTHLERESKMHVGMITLITQKDWLKFLYREVKESAFNEKSSIRTFNANTSFQGTDIFYTVSEFPK